MNEETKLILTAYRPNGADSTDPTFAEALATVGSDPALRQWFAEQQDFDREVSRKIAELAAPAGLRERILAGVKVSQPRRGWHRPQLWMVAAAVALLACLIPLI